MKKYDSYKDSGIEWIGEIPSHWEVNKLFRLFKINTGFTPSTSNSEFYENGNYDWINISDLESKYVSTSKTKLTEKAIEGKEIVPKGSLMYSFKLSVGKMAFADKDLFTNEAIFSIFPDDEINLNYYYYLLDRILIHNSNENIYGAKILNQELIKASKLIVPSKEEQTTIANFLDQKTSQIDDLIAKKERLIQLLEEERTAIINQAVTKGLDPTVHMKDSGIEWLGEIPAHWEEARIKNVVNIIGRIGFRGYTTQDLVQKGEGAISLSPSNIKNHILNIDDCTYLSWEKYHESPEIKIFENDIILVKTGSTIGKTAIIPSGTPEMTLNPQLVVFKDIKLNPVFLYYIMISNYFQGYFSIYTAGGSTPAISQEKINNFKITFPSELEQLEISNFISQKESEIKRIISKTQQEIELLKEYKTALISEVVTGKVDVREEIFN